MRARVSGGLDISDMSNIEQPATDCYLVAA
jgi:hypothetical protein